MSQFRSTGGLDDSIGEDVDRGFSGVNQRLQLNQLQETEVRESLNGRMEGYWRPRRGVVEKTSALTTGIQPLQLPFLLLAEDQITISDAVSSTNLVTITTATNHGFSIGDFVSVLGLGYSSGTNPNGVVQITASAGLNTFAYALTSASGTYTFVGAQTSQMGRTISSAVFTAAAGPLPAFITLTISGSAFGAQAIGSSGNAQISGLVFTGTDFNGTQELEVVTTTTLKLTLPLSATTTAVALGTNPRIHQLLLNDAANANVRASCLFSDPNTNNKEYVIVALDTVAKKIDLATYVATDIPYPAGQALGSDTDMIQVFDKVMLFRDGQQAFEWYPNGRPILSASQSGTTTVTVRLSEHGLVVGTSIVVAGLTGGTPANGTFLVATVIDQNVFTYVFTTSQTQTFGVGSATITDGFTLSPGGGYTQPQVFNANGLEIKALDGLVTMNVSGNLTLEQGDVVSVYECTIPEFTPILGEKFYVASASLNEIQFYAPVPNYTRGIVSASQIGTDVTANVKGHGFAVSDSITVAGLTGVSGGTIPNGTQTVTSVNGDVFTYTATAALTYYTISIPLNITATTVPSTGIVEVTIVGHGLGSSGWATISGYTGANSYLNGSHLFTRHSANALHFTVSGITTVLNQSAVLSQMKYDFTTTGATAIKPTRSTQQIEVGGQFSVGGGFMHQPGAPWGVHFQRRLWVPYYYDQSGAYNAATYTDRKITDEIAVSDILDTTTFDQIQNQFRISGGTADYVVGMHGFYDDALVVLNRNSLHLVSNTQGSLLDTKVKELTSEVGCLARKSVVMRGNTMMFLSDDGVYAVEFLNDYNLRGADEPISKNIQPYIDRINKDYADRAVGVLFDNRYYLAVPLDYLAGANDARGNNSILVFNFLNKGWESLDTYGDSRFLIKNFVIGSAGVRNNIYAVTGNGGLHQIDAVDSSVDRLNVSNVGSLLVTPTINASLTTRGYDIGTMERKRFTDAQIVMQNLAGETGEYMISFASEDPDNASEIGTTTQFLGGEILSPSSPDEAETAGIRCRLGGIRGYTGTMILTRTQGSPKINSVKVAGSVTNRQIISQK